MKTPLRTTYPRPFPIYIPATEDRPAQKVATIEVQVWFDADGDEILTPESSELIDRTRARYMGLMLPEEIRAVRERYGLSQDELSDLLGCGKKSLSRWENGRGYASRLVSTILRCLAEGAVTPATLRNFQRPRFDWSEKIIHGDFHHANRFDRPQTMTYRQEGALRPSEAGAELMAM